MHYHSVPVDIESVRAQLSNELNRSVTDLDVVAWLRRCGCIHQDGRWVATSMGPVSRRIIADPVQPIAATA
jgi:hypothetical protein